MKNCLLLENLEKVHTTELGVDRLKKNLNIDEDDVVLWCKEKIKKEDSVIFRKGKNWYVKVDDVQICINASSYTIITAHKLN